MLDGSTKHLVLLQAEGRYDQLIEQARTLGGVLLRNRIMHRSDLALLLLDVCLTALKRAQLGSASKARVFNESVCLAHFQEPLGND